MKLEHINPLLEDVEKLAEILKSMRSFAQILEGAVPYKVTDDQKNACKNALNALQKDFDCWGDNYEHDFNEWLKTTEKPFKQQSEVFKTMAEIFRPINQNK